jgi:hypothetical protein
MYIPASSSDRMSEEVSVEVEQQLKDKLLQLAATAEQVGWLVGSTNVLTNPPPKSLVNTDFLSL